MKWDLSKVATLFGIILPLWGGLVFLYTYEKNLVKKGDLSLSELTATIERTEILIAIHSHRVEELTEAERNEYERHKARLINLEAQRDKILGIE